MGSDLEARANFDQRILAHREELLGFLRRRAPQDAEELAQEVWLKVAKANPDCPDEKSFRAYMYTVARRQLIDHHRRRMARVKLVGAEPGAIERLPAVDSPESVARARDIHSVVEQVLASMKQEIAEVFRLRTQSDLSFKRIAEQQNVGLNTALGRMHRATKLIAAALAEEGLTEGGVP